MTETRNPAFEAKVRRARWAIVAEQVWLRLWLLAGLLALFFAISLLDGWTYLPPTLHKLFLGLFALAGLAWLIFVARIPWPSREDAIRRIERVSDVPHRPATSYEDHLTASAGDPDTQTLWQAHRQRMANLITKLRAGWPHPGTYRFDPLALRALGVIVVVAAAALTGPAIIDRMTAAFRLDGAADLDTQRLDAWITPPAYTGRAPIMLADGARPRAELKQTASETALQVPEGSVLVVRLSGATRQPLAVEIATAADVETESARGTTGATNTKRIEAPTDAGTTASVAEVRAQITASGSITASSGSTILAHWPLEVIADNVPGIALTKNPERTARGALKLTYFVQDDYGVASAEVKFKRVKEPLRSNPQTAWAQPQRLKGPRAPYSRPPQLPLRLPAPNATQGEAFTFHEIGSHPWAGQRVMMTLEATDVGGKVGRSQPVEIVLPEREFTKPLARALIEQRKLLIEDPRHAERVATALDALTLEPEGFIDDPRVYLPLRAVIYRVTRDRTRAGVDSVIDQLWHTALRIEDGDLSDAERNLRAIQDQLAKALEEGASDEEIQRLMQELREAFNEFARELAQQQQNDPNTDGQNQDAEQLSAEELDRMLRDMEEMAKSGLRDQAKEMLAEMRDLMERMQAQRQNPEQQQRNAEAEKMIRKLGEAVGQQQDLMDETFDQGRQQQQQPGQGPGQMKQSQPGQQGQRGQGMQADRRQGLGQNRGDGQGELMSRERGRDAQGRGERQGEGQRSSLAQRQQELRERLEALRRDMQEKGLGDGERLSDAARAMQEAEEALRQGQYDEANQHQAEALENMREGAQEMAQQAQQGNQQRFGQNGDTPRDPLGRPQRSRGPDQGRSVKVPDQIDMQRARELMEELRRRLGEAKRPQIELDYLERLLRWY